LLTFENILDNSDIFFKKTERMLEEL